MADTLEELSDAENVNGYTFRPTERAMNTARAYLAPLAGAALPAPEFISDGEGGIDIEWSKGAEAVSLSCRADERQPDYVFIAGKHGSGSYPATAAGLQSSLDWLTRESAKEAGRG